MWERKTKYSKQVSDNGIEMIKQMVIAMSEPMKFKSGKVYN